MLSQRILLRISKWTVKLLQLVLPALAFLWRTFLILLSIALLLFLILLVF